MERIFISYTYNPVDAYKQETETFISHIKIMIEAMGITLLDGMDVGGWAIDTEIEKKDQSIRCPDCCYVAMAGRCRSNGDTNLCP